MTEARKATVFKAPCGELFKVYYLKDGRVKWVTQSKNSGVLRLTLLKDAVDLKGYTHRTAWRSTNRGVATYYTDVAAYYTKFGVAWPLNSISSEELILYRQVYNYIKRRYL